jgi:hypothetical protein
VGKEDARKAYARALKRIAKEHSWSPEKAAAFLHTRMSEFATSAVVQQSDRKFIPYPSTWLNKGRYDDDASEWSRDVSGNGELRNRAEPERKILKPVLSKQAVKEHDNDRIRVT